MIQSRTHRRRAPARDGKNRNGASPSVFELLLRHFAGRIADLAVRRVKHGAREVALWTVPRLVLGWIGAAVLTGGVLLMLGAGVKGLEALHWPVWLAYLSTGVFALLVALVAMKLVLRPGADEDCD